MLHASKHCPASCTLLTAFLQQLEQTISSPSCRARGYRAPVGAQPFLIRQKEQLQMSRHLGHCQSGLLATSSTFSPYRMNRQSPQNWPCRSAMAVSATQCVLLVAAQLAAELPPGLDSKNIKGCDSYVHDMRGLLLCSRSGSRRCGAPGFSACTDGRSCPQSCSRCACRRGQSRPQTAPCTASPENGCEVC